MYVCVLFDVVAFFVLCFYVCALRLFSFYLLFKCVFVVRFDACLLRAMFVELAVFDCV